MVEKDLPSRIIEGSTLNNSSLNEFDVWRPSRLGHDESIVNAEERQTNKLYKTMTSILNKLTPENYPKMVNKVKTLSIVSPSQIIGVADLIHKKAINEPKFCGLYAKLCVILGDKWVIHSSETMISFRLTLISKCQEHFELSLTEDLVYYAKKINILMYSNEELKKELLKTYEIEEYINRKKSVGNCRFIGELFKVRLIIPKVIEKILYSLIQSGGPLALECLCMVLKIAGKHYEEKYEEIPDVILNKMKMFSESENLSLRTRFLLLDILELKSQAWKPRFEEELPKTFIEIEEDLRAAEIDTKTQFWSKDKSKRSKNKLLLLSKDWTALSKQFKNEPCFEVQSKEYTKSKKKKSEDPPQASEKNPVTYDVSEVCINLFNDYLTLTFEDFINSFKSSFCDQFSQVVFEFIKQITENHKENCEKLGEMFVSLIDEKVICVDDITEGLAFFLSSIQKDYIPFDLERILNPLFNTNTMQFENLIIVFNKFQQEKNKQITSNSTIKDAQPAIENEKSTDFNVEVSSVSNDKKVLPRPDCNSLISIRNKPSIGNQDVFYEKFKMSLRSTSSNLKSVKNSESSSNCLIGSENLSSTNREFMSLLIKCSINNYPDTAAKIKKLPVLPEDLNLLKNIFIKRVLSDGQFQEVGAALLYELRDYMFYRETFCNSVSSHCLNEIHKYSENEDKKVTTRKQDTDMIRLSRFVGYLHRYKVLKSSALLDIASKFRRGAVRYLIEIHECCLEEKLEFDQNDVKDKIETFIFQELKTHAKLLPPAVVSQIKASLNASKKKVQKLTVPSTSKEVKNVQTPGKNNGNKVKIVQKPVVVSLANEKVNEVQKSVPTIKKVEKAQKSVIPSTSTEVGYMNVLRKFKSLLEKWMSDNDYTIVNKIKEVFKCGAWIHLLEIFFKKVVENDSFPQAGALLLCKLQSFKIENEPLSDLVLKRCMADVVSYLSLEVEKEEAVSKMTKKNRHKLKLLTSDREKEIIRLCRFLAYLYRYKVMNKSLLMDITLTLCDAPTKITNIQCLCDIYECSYDEVDIHMRTVLKEHMASPVREIICECGDLMNSALFSKMRNFELSLLGNQKVDGKLLTRENVEFTEEASSSNQNLDFEEKLKLLLEKYSSDRLSKHATEIKECLKFCTDWELVTNIFTEKVMKEEDFARSGVLLMCCLNGYKINNLLFNDLVLKNCVQKMLTYFSSEIDKKENQITSMKKKNRISNVSSSDYDIETVRVCRFLAYLYCHKLMKKSIFLDIISVLCGCPSNQTIMRCLFEIYACSFNEMDAPTQQIVKKSMNDPVRKMFDKFKNTLTCDPPLLLKYQGFLHFLENKKEKQTTKSAHVNNPKPQSNNINQWLPLFTDRLNNCRLDNYEVFAEEIISLPLTDPKDLILLSDIILDRVFKGEHFIIVGPLFCNLLSKLQIEERYFFKDYLTRSCLSNCENYVVKKSKRSSDEEVRFFRFLGFLRQFDVLSRKIWLKILLDLPKGPNKFTNLECICEMYMNSNYKCLNFPKGFEKRVIKPIQQIYEECHEQMSRELCVKVQNFLSEIGIKN